MSTGFTTGETTGSTLGTSEGGTLGVSEDSYLLDGLPLPTQTREIATHQTLTLGFRVTTKVLKNVLRPLKTDEDQTSILSKDDGGFSSVDRADGSNTYTLTPPPRRQPLRREGTYHVQRYEEDLVSEDVGEWQVEVEFAPAGNRMDVKTIEPGSTQNDTSTGGDAGGTLGASTGFTLGGEYGATIGNQGQGVPEDYWGLTTRYGTISTDRVDADFLGTGRDGVERYELTARLEFEQAWSFESALSRLGGSRVRQVPDGTNVVVDDTSDDANTLDVSVPYGQDAVSAGEYIILGWESLRRNDRFQDVSMTIAVSE